MNRKPALDPSRAVWRKSRRSGDSNGNCVEVCDNQPGVIGVRDSKNPTGGHLTFPSHEWRAFVEGVRAGEFDI